MTTVSQLLRANFNVRNAGGAEKKDESSEGRSERAASTRLSGGMDCVPRWTVLSNGEGANELASEILKMQWHAAILPPVEVTLKPAQG